MYCSVCGSEDMTEVTMHDSAKRGAELRPVVSAGQLGIEIGSLRAESDAGVTYGAMMCLVCRNNIKLKTSGLQPIAVPTSDPDRVIIIPYFLAMVLRTKDKAVELVCRYRDRLEKIFNKWLRTAQNRCRGCKVGVKTTFNVRNFKINCWVIVEQVDIYYMRLTYGGSRIICP